MSRKRLPNRRPCVISKGAIGDGRRSFFVTVDFDDDGVPLGIDLKTAKVGSDFRAIMDAFGVTASLALQNGVSWESLMTNWRKRCPEMADLIQNARDGYDGKKEQ